MEVSTQSQSVRDSVCLAASVGIDRYGLPPEPRGGQPAIVHAVVNEQVVRPPACLPLHRQIIAVEGVVILRPVDGLVLGHEQPDRVVPFGSEDAVVDGRINDAELRLEFSARVYLTDD